MYVKHLTKIDLLNFLKEEYKYAKFTPLVFERNEKDDTATLDVKLVNVSGDIFKFKAIFSDFKCEVKELVSGKSIAKFDTKWVDWFASMLKAKENIGQTRPLSDSYRKSYDNLKQKTTKPKKAKKVEVVVEDDSLKVG